jgi:hypothetical protein
MVDALNDSKPSQEEEQDDAGKMIPARTSPVEPVLKRQKANERHSKVQ